MNFGKYSDSLQRASVAILLKVTACDVHDLTNAFNMQPICFPLYPCTCSEGSVGIGRTGSPRWLVGFLLPLWCVCGGGAGLRSSMYVCMYVLTAKAFHISRGDYGLDPSIMGNKHAGRRKNTHH